MEIGRALISIVPGTVESQRKPGARIYTFTCIYVVSKRLPPGGE